MGSTTRRELLKMLPLAGSALLLHPGARQQVLDGGLALSDAAAGASFRRAHLAPTFADGEVTPLDRYPLNSYLVDDPEVDLESWQLEVSGLVQRAGMYSLDAIKKLPKRSQNTKHLCVEGWDVIGNYGGARISDFLHLVGADLSSRFIELACADDYYESIDLASALHPQSLLCYEMYGQPLPRTHGAPLRLVLPTKLGYKQAKYIVGLKVTNVLSAKRGYWEDQGYSWHGGI